jgi:hypothetical protein
VINLGPLYCSRTAIRDRRGRASSRYSASGVTPISSATCGQRPFAGSASPISAIQASTHRGQVRLASNVHYISHYKLALVGAEYRGFRCGSDSAGRFVPLADVGRRNDSHSWVSRRKPNSSACTNAVAIDPLRSSSGLKIVTLMHTALPVSAAARRVCTSSSHDSPPGMR